MSGVPNTQRLRGLLTAAKEDRAWSYDDLVKRSAGRLKRSTIHALVTRPERQPMPGEVLRSVAETFALNYDEVLRAHLADMDLDPSGSEADDGAPIALYLPLHGELTTRQRSALATVAAAMLDPDGNAAPIGTDEATDERAAWSDQGEQAAAKRRKATSRPK